MTPRENVDLVRSARRRQSLKNKVAEHPHSKFPVCNEDIDHIIGYVDSKDLLNRVLATRARVNRRRADPQYADRAGYPDPLSAGKFKTAGEDFAVIVNEYALVVGIITSTTS